jgi:hypothetical protein
VALRPDSGSWPALKELRSHTHWTHHNRYDSSGRVISPSQRPLPDSIHHLQETNIHAPSEIRTRNPRKRGTAHPRVRVRRPYWPVNIYRRFGESPCLHIKGPSVQKRWSDLNMSYLSPKVGNYLVFATRHGINISKDLDLHCFALSVLHTYTTEFVTGQRHEFRSHSALSDSRLSEHALGTPNS